MTAHNVDPSRLAVAKFVDDEELRLRINPKMSRERFALAVKAAQKMGFPQISPQWCGRNWSACDRWLDKHAGGLNDGHQFVDDGEECFDAPKGHRPGFKLGKVLKDGTRRPYWVARQVVRNPMGFPDL